MHFTKSEFGLKSILQKCIAHNQCNACLHSLNQIPTRPVLNWRRMILGHVRLMRDLLANEARDVVSSVWSMSEKLNWDNWSLSVPPYSLQIAEKENNYRPPCLASAFPSSNLIRSTSCATKLQEKYRLMDISNDSLSPTFTDKLSPNAPLNSPAL